MNKMTTKVDSALELIEENKMPDNSEILTRSIKLVEGIKGFEDDTIQLAIALKFERFKKMFDELTSFSEKYKELTGDVKVEKEVLNRLKKDITQGNGKRHKYDEYLSFEEKKVTELESASIIYAERWKEINTVYDELHNEIDQILVERFKPDKVR